MKDKKKILFGVTGAIGSINAPAYIQQLITDFEVDVVFTKSAGFFINPEGMKPIANGVYTEAFDLSEKKVPHANLPKEADAFVILPTSANFLSKLANGIADDLLSLCALNYEKPIFLAPNMNKVMWEKKSVQRNVELLKNDGHIFINESSEGYEASTGKRIISEAALPAPRTLQYYLSQEVFV
ncbi:MULTISPECIES: flavoprotein [Sediminibacillus]|uniref:flavoprotein n=1 Tax=Sediminibacillus TaxID=482460 RepID=UPI0003F9F67E|nr:flavoprotein [Sediminibacillus terrae]